MAIENYDLKTAQANIGASAANIIAEAVPAGMKRYITFLKYCNTNAAAQNITVSDSDISGGGDVDTTLDIQRLSSAATIMFPDNPDPEKPIMSLVAGQYLTGIAETGDHVMVTVGYYDE